tara:strand:- start:3934 stop:5367 length:1434 start_codon:yes stop_codon:yes gene_type:complete
MAFKLSPTLLVPRGAGVTSYEQAVLDLNPSIYWSMDQNGNDISGNGHDGIEIGGPLVFDNTNAPPMGGGSLSLDGTQNLQTNRIDDQVDLSDGLCAMMTWVRSEAYAFQESVGVVGLSATTNHWMRLSHQSTTSSTQYFATSRETGDSSANLTKPDKSNSWVMTAARFSATNLRTLIYNGHTPKTNTSTRTPVIDDHRFVSGFLRSSRVTGRVSHVVLWSKDNVPSNSEFLDLYLHGIGYTNQKTRNYIAAVLALNPAIYWPLDDVSGATDLGDNGHDGENTGVVFSNTNAPPMGGGSGLFDRTERVQTERIDDVINVDDGLCGMVAWGRSGTNSGDGQTIGILAATTESNDNYTKLHHEASGTNTRYQATSRTTSSESAQSDQPAGDSVDKWVMMAANFYDTASRNIYIDGTTHSAADSTSNAVSLTSHRFRVGMQTVGLSEDRGYEGRLCHVALFDKNNRPSEADLADLYTTATS